MDYRTYDQRLRYIIELIEKSRFVSLQSVARRFGCSTRTIKRMLNLLREKGHDIRYDRKAKKYFIVKS